MSAPYDQHQIRMVVNDHTASSRQLAALLSKATGVLMATSSIRQHLWDHDGRIRVERCLLECVIKRHSGLTFGVMVWGAISYHGRSSLLRIEGNLNSNRYVREVLQPEVVPFLQSILGAG
ncbi:transposable element Tc1 transposase [Trichonephila clavipes]|uniref:Transposable element Tc1 transposase n=1 Tax=Trichonephila clavipes TaxID=2585209 RepID=A0A8X6SBS2_TRICX|nr:transposable element Tc1 transposase [Trichonephila clavipes]